MHKKKGSPQKSIDYLIEQKDYKEAIHLINEKISTDSDGFMHLKRAFCYIQLKQANKATKDCMKAKTINPEISQNYIDYADISDKINKTKNKKVLANLYNSRGLTLYMLNHFDKAKDDFIKAIELYPDCAEAYRNLSGVHIINKEFTKAMESMKKALSIDPTLLDNNLKAASTLFNEAQSRNQVYMIDN